jgi:hypothetical protein
MAYRSRFADPPPRRPGRLRLMLPAITVGVMSVALCGFWLYASWKTGSEIDGWLAREASLGRNWTCPDRKIAGFPFRIELSCTTPSFEGSAEGRGISGTLGRVLAVAQIYTPSHVIIEAESPLVVRERRGGTEWRLAWEGSLRASVIGQPGKLDRIAVQVTSPVLSGTVPDGTPVAFRAREAEAHLRRTPDRPQADGAFDVAVTIDKASVPPLDALLRGGDPTDANLVMTLTHAEPFSGRGLPAELDRWREAGGRLQLTTLTLSKGAKRIDASGNLGLDDMRRPQGRVELSLTGLEEVLQSMGLSNRSAGIGGLIAGVLTGRRSAQPAEPAPGTAAAPRGVVLPLRLESGRAYLGPIPVAPLPPLY